MHILYVDESYDHQKFVMTALCIEDVAWRQTFDAVKTFRRELKEEWGIRISAELHAKVFVRDCSDNASTRKLSQEERREIFKLVMKHMAGLQIVLLNVCLDVPRWGSTAKAHAIAVERLANRVQTMMRVARSHAVVVFDEGKEAEIRKTVRRMNVFNPIPSAYPKQQHAFMGLLTCGRCGCSITAERKKGKYTYYRCTGFHGRCGNAYIREELLADLLGDVVKRIQTPSELADWIVDGLRESQSDVEQARQVAVAQLTQRRRAVQAKLDRGYDDYLEGRISAGFWTRKSEEWEAELGTIDAESTRVSRPTPAYTATAEKILELAKTAHFRYLEQSFEERRRLLETVLSNCTFDRGSLCPTYVQPFDVLSKAVETGDWRGGRDSNPRPPA